jgi:hypothetical protein
MRRRCRWLPVTAAACAAWLAVGTAAAQGSDARATARDGTDQYDLSVRSETYAELFQRALLPGPAGAIVDTGTAAPVHQLIYLRAHDLDTSWREDAIDVEVAAWGRGWLGDQDLERRFDGDVQIASARYRHGPLSVRLGRQQVAGGAARWVRFDGALLAASLVAGLSFEAYGGLTVLPRWDARPGYHHLGGAADSLLRSPEAAAEPERAGNLLAGGRFAWSSERAAAALSFHEQHEDLGISRRTLGGDGRVRVTDRVSLGAAALMELDALRLQDGRLWVDATPAAPLDVSLEYLHTEPALFLSRQSVLSVFSTEAYEEVGATTLWRANRHVTVDAGGWVEIYEIDRAGARGNVGASFLPGAGGRTRVRVGYARMLAPDNGYHGVRAALSRRIALPVTGTLEAFGYLYDEPILGRITSAVYAGTLGWQTTRVVNLTWGASLAQSPYASFDAQTILRLALDLDLSRRRLAR